MKPYYRIFNTSASRGRVPAVKHATLEAASTEALRLARLQPGDTFEIVQVVGIARTAEPSIFWNDGCAPPAVPVDPGDGWRLLEEGETIRAGDEVADDEWCSGWDRVTYPGPTYRPDSWYPVRRRTHRDLEPGEVVRDGDEWLDDVDYSWVRCRASVGRNFEHSTHYRTRRPIP